MTDIFLRSFLGMSIFINESVLYKVPRTPAITTNDQLPIYT